MLGLVGPVITLAKLILREVSELRTECDEIVPQVIINKWICLRNELFHLNHLKVPRWILAINTKVIELTLLIMRTELVFIVDASMSMIV